MFDDRSRSHASENPYQDILSGCRNLLREALSSSFPDFQDAEIKLEEPPSAQFGDLSTILSYQISKALGVPAIEIAQRIASSSKPSSDGFVRQLEASGAGYLNLRLNYEKINELTLHSVRSLSDRYGFPHTDRPERIAVEHSSINPVHSIHIGQARNSILGDAITRILKARGHEVEVHFYINDAGRQSAIVSYGYEKIRRPTPSIKPDHYLGQVYSITSCLVEIQSLKKIMSNMAGDESLTEERRQNQNRLDEWTSISFELQNRHPELFENLRKEISISSEADTQINNLLREYEQHTPSATDLIRQVSELCINGFKQTFSRLDICFDVWDWESDLLWSHKVADVLQRLLKTKYVSKEDGTLRLESEMAVEELGIRELLNVGDGYVLPSVSLTRSDGTTLYLSRDIAYSLLKFERCSSVVNVVGMEQVHEQLHVRVALSILGLKELARKQQHFTFGLVRFPGEKMSSRRGRIVSLDDVIDEAIRRAYVEIEKRSSDLDDAEKRRRAETIGIGALKYALLSVEPSREVDFSWERVLNLEMNSAPFINYGYTRANGILRKIGSIRHDVNYERLDSTAERRIILTLAKFPSIFAEAADRLRPDDLANYVNQLTKQFHEYYEQFDVSHLNDDELRNARGSLVEAIQIVIRNCMCSLGIELQERM
jgi:arginyl-tRNA synthetase